jgi:hypothetical protein
MDRSPAMARVALDVAASVRCSHLDLDLDFVLGESLNGIQADLAIFSNVLNEGEGIEDPWNFLFARVDESLSNLILIEPATETSSRRLCETASTAPSGWNHVGPCPSGGSLCRQWTFRQFAKRLYPFEQACLGDLAGAARSGKYSLALLSRTIPVPTHDPGAGIVTISSSRGVTVCSMAAEAFRLPPKAVSPWDYVRPEEVIRGWP